MERHCHLSPIRRITQEGSGTFRNTRYSLHEIFIILVGIMEFLRQDFLSLRNH